jgi:hypothetical protein
LLLDILAHLRLVEYLLYLYLLHISTPRLVLLRPGKSAHFPLSVSFALLVRQPPGPLRARSSDCVFLHQCPPFPTFALVNAIIALRSVLQAFRTHARFLRKRAPFCFLNLRTSNSLVDHPSTLQYLGFYSPFFLFSLNSHGDHSSSIHQCTQLHCICVNKVAILSQRRTQQNNLPVINHYLT